MKYDWLKKQGTYLHTCIRKEGIMRKMKCDDIMMSKRASVWITDTGVNLNSIPFKVPKITFHVEWLSPHLV